MFRHTVRDREDLHVLVSETESDASNDNINLKHKNPNGLPTDDKTVKKQPAPDIQDIV